ncbi:MAG: hypothetical protein NTU47_02315 [Ignavibacteriales bacterium]|nr:hypothetical protein [Ignavibacteriales bacterium]
MPSIQLQQTDYGGCKMTPKPNSTITLKRALPDGQWTAPANPPKTFEGRPTAGGNDITLNQPWAEYQIDIRANLIDAIVAALQGLFNSFSTLLAGEINKGVSDAAERLRELIGDKFRELQITWTCEFEVDTATTVLVIHSHDYNVQITKTVATAKDRMSWLMDTRLRIAGQMADGARIHVNGKATQVDSAEAHDMVSVGPGTHTVESMSRIRLDCEGFLHDIENIFNELVAAIQEGLNLQQAVADFIAQWIRDHTTTTIFVGGPPSADDVEAERKRKKEELEARIKADIKRCADTIYKELINLLQEYRGQVAIDKSMVELVCLSESGIGRIRTALHSASKKEVDKNKDNKGKTRSQILKSDEHGMLIPGRKLIANDDWLAMGLTGADYYFMIVPADQVERPVKITAFTSRAVAPEETDGLHIESPFGGANAEITKTTKEGGGKGKPTNQG